MVQASERGKKLRAWQAGRTLAIERLRAKLRGIIKNLEPPQDLEIPQSEAGERVWWTGGEIEAVYNACKEVKEQASFVDWAHILPGERSQLFTFIFNATNAQILPPARHRKVMGVTLLYGETRERFQELFGMTKQKPVATPPNFRRHIIWTEQEEQAFMVHLCHLMRKQGLRDIPQTNDRNGSVLFNSFVRRANEDALPSHRRKNFAPNARVVFVKLDLLNRLEPMLKLPVLPHLPPPPQELQPKGSLAPFPTNGHANGNGNGHGDHSELEALGTPEPASIVPLTKTLAEYSDAELYQEATMRMLHMAAVVNEAKGLADLLTEENAKLVQRVNAMEAKFAEFTKPMAEKPVEIKKQYPICAVVGCRQDEFDQIQRLTREHGIEVKLRLYEQGTKERPIDAEWAIALRWISHAWTDQMKASIPRLQQIFLHAGGVSRVVAQLETWFHKNGVAV